jgi:DNA-binding GntR family transcriptional regulator
VKIKAEFAAAADGGRERCLAQIRDMILTGQLLPGQKVHQGQLADHLNTSPIPVREALATLQAEGVVDHKTNTGYTVARFSSEELSEIYLMRRLLETELLRSIDLASVDVGRMVDLNKQMNGIKGELSRETYQELNLQFHFVMFDRSELKLVRREVRRLWYMSGFYRSLYLYESATAAHLSTEHGQIIDAVRAGDVKQLIRIANQHRSGTERMVVQRLGSGRSD